MIKTIIHIAAEMVRVFALPLRVMGESLLMFSSIYDRMADRIDPPCDELELQSTPGEPSSIEMAEDLPLWCDNWLV